jgi:hypothetical protein
VIADADFSHGETTRQRTLLRIVLLVAASILGLLTPISAR